MTADRYRDWDGAYVLGALSADERAEYEEHLAACDECRAALNDLAGLPGILGRLDRESALAIEAIEEAPTTMPVHDLVPRLSRRAARGRRLRRGLVGVAVALGVVAGALLGVALPGLIPGPDRTLALVPQQHSTVSAQLTATAAPWGTRLSWSCAYGDAAASARYTDVRYELTVTTSDGRVHDVATWTASGTSSTGLAASTAIPRDTIASVAIRTTTGVPLAVATL